MATFEAPFTAAYEPGKPPGSFEPGYVLALARSKLEAGELSAGTGEHLTVATPWGDLVVEVRGPGSLVCACPSHEVSAPRVLTTVAAMRLGVSKEDVEATEMAIQELDVGRRVLVVPLPGATQVDAAPRHEELGAIPGVQATGGIVYARTQRTPYVKIAGKLLGDAEPLSALAAAAMHLVANIGVRATYPRTRVVGELVARPGDRAEITVQARKAGHEPQVEALFVGGAVKAPGAAGNG